MDTCSSWWNAFACHQGVKYSQRWFGVISMGQHSSQRSLVMLQVFFKHLSNKFLILQTPEEQSMARVLNKLYELYGMLWNSPRFLLKRSGRASKSLHTIRRRLDALQRVRTAQECTSVQCYRQSPQDTAYTCDGCNYKSSLGILLRWRIVDRHYYEGLETITKRSLEKTDTSQGVAETALRTGAPPGRQLHGLIALRGDKKEKWKRSWHSMLIGGAGPLSKLRLMNKIT